MLAAVEVSVGGVTARAVLVRMAVASISEGHA
jgi:hypothetical protein